VQMMKEKTQRQITELKEEQEQEIVSDLELLLVAVCVLNRWTLEGAPQAHRRGRVHDELTLCA
jgi:hypothetical protein